MKAAITGLAVFSLAALFFADNPKNPANDLLSGQRQILGFRDASPEISAERTFLSVPDPKLAEEHLRTLTKAPHIAASPEDRATADYVAQKFRDAGLETEISEYRVWLNYPSEISVEITAPSNVTMHGPTREHVSDDPYQDDPRIVAPYSGMSPSGDVEAEVVYANYGTPEDFKKLDELKIDVRGKIVIARYGQNFRGVKILLAQEHGAAGVILYSDPADDGWVRGDKYPAGPWRPDTGVQRGSIGYMFEFPGDPTTPGLASSESLPDSQRTPPEQSKHLPKVPTTPLSYGDAWPILQNLAGPDSPRDWQGALPFTYHVGPGPVKVKMHLKQDYQFRTIWDVTGRIRGSEYPDEVVVAGNHRDAWVYGAVDPNSGTAAMLETVHGLGQLLKSGWRPKRSIVMGSWDAEEFGLIGSTEWAEQHESDLRTCVGYFNMDVAVTGPKFSAAGVPSLKQFVRDAVKAAPSPVGGSVYGAWKKTAEEDSKAGPQKAPIGGTHHPPAAQTVSDVPVGDLGSGSDFTVFLQHLGVPATDITSSGPYGVYHSAFDDFAWFKKFGDPNFLYEQEMARVFGLEVMRLADTDVLPYDYETYGKEIGVFLESAKTQAESQFHDHAPDFKAAIAASHRLAEAGAKLHDKQVSVPQNPKVLNQALLSAEHALLIPEGLPGRPWYKHAVFAPGRYTGYAAVVIPGVNEAIEGGDAKQASEELAILTAALDRAIKALQGYR